MTRKLTIALTIFPTIYIIMVLVRSWGNNSLSQPAADSSLGEGAIKKALFQCFPKASLLEGGGPEGAGGSAAPHILTNAIIIQDSKMIRRKAP